MPSHQKYSTLQEPINVRAGARDLPPRVATNMRHSHRETAIHNNGGASHRRAEPLIAHEDHRERRDLPPSGLQRDRLNSSEGAGMARLNNSGSMPNHQSMENLASSMRTPITVYEGGRGEDNGRPPVYGSMRERANRTLDAEAIARQHQRLNSSTEGRFRHLANDARNESSNLNNSSY